MESAGIVDRGVDVRPAGFQQQDAHVAIDEAPRGSRAGRAAADDDDVGLEASGFLDRCRRPVGPSGHASAIQTLLTSVYSSIASRPISRPQPLAFTPPHGRCRVERVGHVHPDVAGANGALASRWARATSRVQIEAPRP